MGAKSGTRKGKWGTKSGARKVGRGKWGEDIEKSGGDKCGTRKVEARKVGREK